MTAQRAYEISYNLADLPYVLPLTNSNQTLRWLKSKYQEALGAVMFGTGHSIIIHSEKFSVTCDHYVRCIDEVTGSISPECARMLIELVNSGAFPRSFLQPNRDICSGFLSYAYS